MIAFPEPTAKRYAATKTSLKKSTVEFLYQSAHGCQTDWDSCYLWAKKIALEKGWTLVAQTKTRVCLEVNKDLNYRNALKT